MAEISTSIPKSQVNPLADPSPALSTVQSTLDKFLTAATVEAVYGPPVSEGENVVIPAAEVLSVVGFGVGLGGGQGPRMLKIWAAAAGEVVVEVDVCCPVRWLPSLCHQQVFVWNPL